MGLAHPYCLSDLLYARRDASKFRAFGGTHAHVHGHGRVDCVMHAMAKMGIRQGRYFRFLRTETFYRSFHLMDNDTNLRLCSVR
jgi:hypothetical protein